MSVVVGIAAGLGGSIAINTGNNLQSLGMQNLEREMIKNHKGHEIPENMKIEPSESRTWRIGTFIFVMGSLLNFASYGFAPQSLLAALEAVQFVTNVFFGQCALGKVVTPRMYLGTFITVMGTMMAIVFSSKNSATVESIDDLLMLWTNLLWLGYLACAVCAGIVIHLLYKVYNARVQTPTTRIVTAILFSTFSALFGTLSVVFAKILAELLDLYFQYEVPIFTHWFLYATLVCWVVLVGVWLSRMNEALSKFDPLFIIPLLQANFILFAMISGGIYFQEFNYMSLIQWAGFVPGVSIIFVGIALLAPADSAQDDANANPERRSNDSIPPAVRRQQQMTQVFMSGASQLFLQASKLATQRFRDEQELLRILDQKELTQRESFRVKQLMGNIVNSEHDESELKHEAQDLAVATGIRERAKTAFEQEEGMGLANVEEGTETPGDAHERKSEETRLTVDGSEESKEESKECGDALVRPQSPSEEDPDEPAPDLEPGSGSPLVQPQPPSEEDSAEPAPDLEPGAGEPPSSELAPADESSSGSIQLELPEETAAHGVDETS